MHLQSLPALLKAAATSSPSNCLIIYEPGSTESHRKISYQDLLAQAEYNSSILQRLDGFEKGKPILIHLDEHLDSFIWFWAVLIAEAIPTPTATFSNIPEQRQKHIEGLANLLGHPICVTRTKLLPLFEGQKELRIHTIESLLSHADYFLNQTVSRPSRSRKDDLAMLMLTSGSTGTPKAVRLRHKQVLAAVFGKLALRDHAAGKPFLNWIGLDHVASIVEIHLTAMYLGVDQVHVHAPDLLANPLSFLTLLSRHEITRTFAPNFFMAKLVIALRSERSDEREKAFDLSHLSWFGSGGEANDLETCTSLSELLTAYGAPNDVIVPGFGMTETCAGSIYNIECPACDVRHQRTFASVGECIPGMEIRVALQLDSPDALDSTTKAGDLEVRGLMVFDGYYNNTKATAEAFTADGWFKTGDQGTIDSDGNLNLVGRKKEAMNINGVKHSPQDIETLVEQALPTQVTRVSCFPYRPPKAQTEQICVAVVLANSNSDAKEVVDINDTIVKSAMLHTGTRPYVLLLSNEQQLPKSTLGKILKTKMRSMLEEGVFASQIEANEQIIQDYRKASPQVSSTSAERLLLDDFSITLGIDFRSWGVEIPIFDAGMTSIDLVRLKQRIENRTGLEIPLTLLMLNPTARSIATALENLSRPKAYDPVVPLKQDGEKTPLWLVHPGVGEILVFLGLSKCMDDRPVYALRARGFDGDPYFSSIDEAVTTYYTAIKQRQPQGPYAIAGYSFGTMLAFEISKRLELGGDSSEVAFLGSFNLPPHIKWRMRQLDWTACLLHLCYFLDLLPESRSQELIPQLQGDAKDSVLAYILSIVDTARMQQLSMSATELSNWASLAHAMQAMAVDYDPSGSVKSMDVFYAHPLRTAAPSKEEWLEQHLSKWAEFCRTEPQFHDVEGAHYTMLSAEHVESFAGKLKQVLQARGL